MARRTIKVRIYMAHWYRNGFCYRTTTNCTKDDIKNLKDTAKMLGETIKTELQEIRTYEY